MQRILFISHDASRTGAVIVLLHLLRWLRETTSLRFDVLLVRGGELESAFAEVAERVLVWHEPRRRPVLARIARRAGRTVCGRRREYNASLLRSFAREPYDLVYVNSVASCEAFLPLAWRLDCPAILHVHEMASEMLVRRDEVQAALAAVQQVIAVSHYVRQDLVRLFGVDEDSVVVMPEFVSAYAEGTGASVRRELSVPSNALMVAGSGTLSLRKGVDCFVQVAQEVLRAWSADRPVHFVWLGGGEPAWVLLLNEDLRKLGIANAVHFVGSQSNPHDYFAASDLFLMTSREDPFPLVCIENAMAGNPIVCFDGATGAQEYIDETCGAVVPYLDTDAMAAEMVRILEDDALRRSMFEEIRKRGAVFTTEKVAPRICELIHALIARHSC